MRKIGISLAFVLYGFLVSAQDNTSGTVVYEQTVKLEIKLEGEAAQFANNFPKERKSQKVLIFNAGQSLYENQKSAEQEDVAMNSNGANVMIRMAEPENKVYTDLTEKKQVEMKEFMTRIFLINRDMAYSWKITGNQKMIRDYPCQEATLMDGENKVTAWFTPAIPVSAGPGKYAGLPGLILSVEQNEGKNITTLQSINLTPVGNDKIVKPEKGKKVSNEEFEKIVAEKVKELGGKMGSGGGATMMIRIQK